MMILCTVRYNVESVATLKYWPRSPYVHFEHVSIFYIHFLLEIIIAMMILRKINLFSFPFFWIHWSQEHYVSYCITDKPTDNKWMVIDQNNLHQTKSRPLSWIILEEMKFPPGCSWQTGGRTTDIFWLIE